MIKFDNTEVFNFEGAIRGMRMPMQSYDKIDSHMGELQGDSGTKQYIIGDNDMGLMKRLVHAGTEHSKFMRQILVSTVITAPDYYFKEFSTYKIGTVENSSSTMHKIMSKEFTEDMFSWEYVSKEYKNYTLKSLNELRGEYLKSKDKTIWYELIQRLPMSFNYERAVTLNYAVLRTMYHQRKDHKLDEWSVGFVEWIKSLPYSELIIE